jgi:hypothetical protein
MDTVFILVNRIKGRMAFKLNGYGT